MSGQNTYTYSPLADTHAFYSDSHEFNLHVEVSHSEFHSDIVWYNLLLLHYFFLPDPSNLLQATERTVR